MKVAPVIAPAEADPASAVNVDEVDDGARIAESHGRGLADADCGAGNHHDSVVEVAVHRRASSNRSSDSPL